MHRTKLKDLAGIFTAWLNDGNVVIVDWLKYHLHWNKLIIDKNAAKSADIWWKHYESVIISNDELLKWKPYAPSQGDEVILLNNMAKSEVIRRVELVDKLVKHGIKLKNINFLDFEKFLSQITWSEKLQKKMDILKWKSYAPCYAFEVVSLSQLAESEVSRRVELVGKLSEYGITTEFLNFYDFKEYLSQITWSEKLQKKMDILKLKRYAPSVLHDVVLLNNMTESEVLKRVEYADDIGLQQNELYSWFIRFTELYIS